MLKKEIDKLTTQILRAEKDANKYGWSNFAYERYQEDLERRDNLAWVLQETNYK